MKEFDFKKIDAFATINSGGNPAGYVLLNSAEDISVDEMQHMARELKGFWRREGFEPASKLFGNQYCEEV